MLKNILNQIKHNHLLMMLVGCLLPIVLIGALIKFFDVSGDYFVWLIILLCPLMHVWMMKKD
ncbi:MAG: DUF2933 domain-containing protein [bacterium]|nr:DUF2933 domain-containing protein [bacterium]